MFVELEPRVMSWIFDIDSTTAAAPGVPGGLCSCELHGYYLAGLLSRENQVQGQKRGAAM
jgi:hypothetical protein